MLKLFYEVPTGKPIPIKIFHTLISGITQSGKTEIMRSIAKELQKQDYTILILDVKSKTGEPRDFEGFGYDAPLYMEQTTDPLILKGLLESESHLRLNFQFPELIRACEDALTIQQVLENVERLLAEPKLHPIRREKLQVLRLLLRKLIEEMEGVKFTDVLEVRKGMINVMDLTTYSDAFKQMVVMACCMYIRKAYSRIAIFFDEAHIHIPQEYGSASKRAVTKLVKEGASSRQFVYVADQAITEIEKSVLKQCDVWVLGKQRELNEAERTYKQLPFKEGIKKEDIMRLETGHFYLCTSDPVKKVYAKPYWLSETEAIAIATGSKSVHDIKPSEVEAGKELVATLKMPDDLDDKGWEVILPLLKQVEEKATESKRRLGLGTV